MAQHVGAATKRPVSRRPPERGHQAGPHHAQVERRPQDGAAHAAPPPRLVQHHAQPYETATPLTTAVTAGTARSSGQDRRGASASGAGPRAGIAARYAGRPLGRRFRGACQLRAPSTPSAIYVLPSSARPRRARAETARSRATPPTCPATPFSSSRTPSGSGRREGGPERGAEALGAGRAALDAQKTPLRLPRQPEQAGVVPYAGPDRCGPLTQDPRGPATFFEPGGKDRGRFALGR